MSETVEQLIAAHLDEDARAVVRPAKPKPTLPVEPRDAIVDRWLTAPPKVPARRVASLSGPVVVDNPFAADHSGDVTNMVSAEPPIDGEAVAPSRPAPPVVLASHASKGVIPPRPATLDAVRADVRELLTDGPMRAGNILHVLGARGHPEARWTPPRRAHAWLVNLLSSARSGCERLTGEAGMWQLVQGWQAPPPREAPQVRPEPCVGQRWAYAGHLTDLTGEYAPGGDFTTRSVGSGRTNSAKRSSFGVGSHWRFVGPTPPQSPIASSSSTASPKAPPALPQVPPFEVGAQVGAPQSTLDAAPDAPTMVLLNSTRGVIERVVVKDHGGVLSVCSIEELRAARAEGRPPIVVGFKKTDVVVVSPPQSTLAASAAALPKGAESLPAPTACTLPASAAPQPIMAPTRGGAATRKDAGAAPQGAGLSHPRESLPSTALPRRRGRPAMPGAGRPASTGATPPRSSPTPASATNCSASASSPRTRCGR